MNLACLWDRKGGSKIDDEIGLQVAEGNLVGVHDELATAENPRTGIDIGSAELDDHVEEVEEVGDGAEEGHKDGEVVAGGHARAVAFDAREVEIERVDEESDDAHDEEDVVPMRYDVAVRVEDLVVP